MKKQMAILFALALLVSAMATVAEEQSAASSEVVEQPAVPAEAVETEWAAPFEDGAWLSVPELNAEVYMPAGWTISEVAEDGFTALDAELISSMQVVLEPLAQEEAAATEEGATLSAFESYLLGLGEEYELALMGESEAAVIQREGSVTVLFPVGSQLVHMTFTPAEAGGVSDNALVIAQTFHLYEAIGLNEESAVG